MQPEELKKGPGEGGEVVIPLEAVGIEREEPFDPGALDEDPVHELSDDDIEEVQEAA